MHRRLRRLARPVWVPFTLAVLLIAGVVVALPWYYKTYRGATPDRGLTGAELEWVGAYAPWRTRVTETLARAHASRNSVDGELGRVLDEISACGDDLRRLAGSPPTARLEPVGDRAVTACALADAARTEYRASGDIPSWRTSARLAAARDALRGAEFDLRRLLLAQRPLERAEGANGESRIEPLLSDAISVEHAAEVSCWSEDEWPQVRAELTVVGLERDERLRREVNAYWFRVHASPSICGRLAGFAETGASVPDRATALALTAVLHVALHAVAAVDDEQEAECGALERVARSAVALGAEAGVAEELAELARASSGCPEGA